MMHWDADTETTIEEVTDRGVLHRAQLLNEPETGIEPRLPEGYAHIRTAIRALLMVADLGPEYERVKIKPHEHDEDVV